MAVRYWNYVVGLAGLALVLALAGHSQSQPISGAPAGKVVLEQTATPSTQLKAVSSLATCDGARLGEDARLCYERRTVEAAEKQASEAVKAAEWAAKSHGLAILQAVATVLSVVFTGWAAFAAASAARSAQRSTDMIPVLEAPYLFAVIQGENIYSAFMAASEGAPSFIESRMPKVDFRVKNYGTTPATIRKITAHLSIVGGVPIAGERAENFITHEAMIGQGDLTDKFSVPALRDMNQSDYFDFHAGNLIIVFDGSVTYSDIWHQEHTVDFTWKYNPSLRRFELLSKSL